MAVTTHRSWTYPDEFEDPYYVSFTTMVQSIDDDVNDLLLSASSVQTLLNGPSTSFASLTITSDIALGAAAWYQVVFDRFIDVGGNYNSSAGTYEFSKAVPHLMTFSAQLSTAANPSVAIIVDSVEYAGKKTAVGDDENLAVTAFILPTTTQSCWFQVYVATTNTLLDSTVRTFAQVVRLA